MTDGQHRQPPRRESVDKRDANLEDGSDGNASMRGVAVAGCLLTMGSALLTCLMLFINGSLVMSVVAVLTESGPPWLGNPKFTQFILFALPILLVVLQWKMIDYVRTRVFDVRRHDRESLSP